MPSSLVIPMGRPSGYLHTRLISPIDHRSNLKLSKYELHVILSEGALKGCIIANHDREVFLVGRLKGNLMVRPNDKEKEAANQRGMKMLAY